MFHTWGTHLLAWSSLSFLPLPVPDKSWYLLGSYFSSLHPGPARPLCSGAIVVSEFFQDVSAYRTALVASWAPVSSWVPLHLLKIHSKFQALSCLVSVLQKPLTCMEHTLHSDCCVPYFSLYWKVERLFLNIILLIFREYYTCICCIFNYIHPLFLPQLL